MQSCAKSWGVFLAKSVNPGAPRRHLSDKSRVVWKLQCKIRNSCASLTTSARALRTSATVSSRQIERILPRHDDFAERHIGPGEKEKRDMLDVLGLEVRLTSLFPSLYEMGAKNPTPFIFIKTSFSTKTPALSGVFMSLGSGLRAFVH